MNVQLGLNSEVCLNELGKKIINNNNWFKVNWYFKLKKYIILIFKMFVKYVKA